MNRNVSINKSDENKAFIWLPPKTGSMHAEVIFNMFSFKFYRGSPCLNYPVETSDFIIHSHAYHLFDGHENYKLICTARNPITRLISAYLFRNPENELTPQGFKKFFSKNLKENQFEYWLGGIKLHREPDYYLRLENLYEDYLKIPFVRESKINEIGILKDFCFKKKNQSNKTLTVEECYTSDMVDYIYNEYKDYFDKLGYERPKLSN